MVSANCSGFLGRPCGILAFTTGVSATIIFIYFITKRSMRDSNVGKKKCGKIEIAQNKGKIQSRMPELNDPGWIEVGCIKELYYYPLKSGRGNRIENCDFTDYGISVRNNGFVTLKDRMFLVYSSKNGKFQTGRKYPKLLLVNIVAVDERSVRLETDGMPSIVFRLPEKEIEESAEVACSMWWGESLKCIDCGSEPAAWISQFLTGSPNSDLRIGSATSNRRNVFKEPWEKFTKVYKSMRNEDTGYFSDLASYMLISESSFGELNKKLEYPISFVQFRPNIIVSSSEPFDEDNWEWIKIGESVVLRNVKPCARCSMIRVDPESATVHRHEPTTTLQSFREQTNPERVKLEGKSPTMGIYCGLYNAGSVKIDDKVFVQRLTLDVKT